MKEKKRKYRSSRSSSSSIDTDRKSRNDYY